MRRAWLEWKDIVELDVRTDGTPIDDRVITATTRYRMVVSNGAEDRPEPARTPGYVKRHPIEQYLHMFVAEEPRRRR